jgi:hypothetical protein
MLDARSWMLDIQEIANGEIQKYRVSSNQYPGPASVFVALQCLGDSSLGNNSVNFQIINPSVANSPFSSPTSPPTCDHLN